MINYKQKQQQQKKTSMDQDRFPPKDLIDFYFNKFSSSVIEYKQNIIYKTNTDRQKNELTNELIRNKIRN